MSDLLDWLLDLLGMRPRPVALRLLSQYPGLFRVEMVNRKGKRVTKDNVAVQATGTHVRLGGRTTERTHNGVAVFSNLSMLPVEGTMSFTLTFSSPGLASVVSDPITLDAVPDGLAFVTPPPATAVDATLFPQPVVLQVTAKGKPVAKAGIQVTVSPSAGAQLIGPDTATSDPAGRLTFAIGLDDLSI